MSSVARHLKIKLSEYDRRIRTFIPYYEEMLATVAGMVKLGADHRRAIIDLGVGTGALAGRCLAAAPNARLLGIDSDREILAMARRRLSRRWNGRITLVHGDFVDAPLPPCDAVVATLALHHIHSGPAKRRFYVKCFAALRRGGILASGDCFLVENRALARRYMETWRAHLRRSYHPRQVDAYFAAWASEDRYFSLSREQGMFAEAGFEVEVAWRRAPFAVLVGRKT